MLKTKTQPDTDICSECKEHCDFEQINEDGEPDESEPWLSNCCGAPPYNTDTDYEPEY